MTPGMFGLLTLLAASASAGPPPAEPVSSQRPPIRATAHATATIRVISGVRFGAGQLSGTAGATRRKAMLTEADGLARSAELLEFQ